MNLTPEQQRFYRNPARHKCGCGQPATGTIGGVPTCARCVVWDKRFDWFVDNRLGQARNLGRAERCERYQSAEVKESSGPGWGPWLELRKRLEALE